MKKEMVLGIPAGSLLDPTLGLLKKVGIEVAVNGRNFMADVRGSSIFSKAIIMRPNDLPLAVKMGVVDVAVTGNDMLLESCLENELCKIAELQFSKKSRKVTRIVVFGREDESDELIDTEDILVSSEYMYLASTIFKNAKIQFSTGSTEIKVAVKEFGFRYGIGVVERGRSLNDNRLKIIRTILISPVVLISKRETIELRILGQMLRGALEAELFQLIKFNADLSDKEQLIEILPAMEAPTISNLADGAIAIETAVPKNIMADTITAIKKAGGRNILVQDMLVSM